MKTILLPTDFSAISKNAIEYAFKLFANDDCTMILLNGFRIPQGGATILTSMNDILEKETTNRLNQLRQDISKKNSNKAHRITVLPVLGDALSAVMTTLDLREIDVIVMGTKGASGMKEVLLGSNASAIIQNATCPVLAVPEHASFETPKNIAFATDYQVNRSEKTLAPLLDLAVRFRSKLHILNVLKDGVKLDVKLAAAGVILNRELEAISHEFHFSTDKDIAHGLATFVEEKNIDMLAMVVRQHSFFENIFHKSITRKMSMHTKVPLLALSDV